MAAKKAAAGGGSKKSLSKSGLITAIVESVGDDVSRKQVKAVMEAVDRAATSVRSTRHSSKKKLSRLLTRSAPQRVSGGGGGAGSSTATARR